jgi:hypothetical protein
LLCRRDRLQFWVATPHEGSATKVDIGFSARN